jgi:hypothetical protein
VSTADPAVWQDANQRYLTAEIARIKALLSTEGPVPGKEAPATAELESARHDLPGPATLDLLVDAFGLSPFERDLLLLLAAVELNGEVAGLCAGRSGNACCQGVTFSLALARLPEPHWSALTPAAGLRHWRLLELGPGDSLVESPLRIDEWALHFLTGVAQLDQRLQGVLEPVPAPEVLTPGQSALAQRIEQLWRDHGNLWTLPAVQLCGDPQSGEQTACAAAQALGWELFRMAAEDLPAAASERESFIRLWERQLLLHPCALFLAAGEMDGPEQVRGLKGFLGRVHGGVIIGLRQTLALSGRRAVTLAVPPPSTDEQRGLWQRALGPVASKLNGDVERLLNQFRLDAGAIMDVGTALEAEAQEGGEEQTGKRLWDACRRQARPRLGELAQRIDSRVDWDDLVLPELQSQTLREMTAQVRRRVRVYEEWGFGAKNPRGMGVTALFHGPSGTGKTLAAEVLSNALELDLYRIDLSTVVSKYIGETEKNLRRIFDAAEYGGAILLFDEADALFGKRSEVKDSHDRYANIEVSYLLQRMDAYRGLAILTSNRKETLDTAFLRRLRFIVQFPFPDAGQRAEIWRRTFPKQAPTEGLDIQKLARLNLAGGHIRNIALNAAFLAADRDRPVTMDDLKQAVRTEYAKLEKPVTSELRDWS